MSEIFQIRCPACNCKLNAKVSLVGQSRNCPKCQTPFVIQQQHTELVAPVIETTETAPAQSDSLRIPQLDFHNRYFILSLDRVIAAWEGSKGWLVNVGSGFAPARTNVAAIPDQGVFAFVEMVMETGIPKKLQISRVSSRGALTVIFRDANAILGKLEETVDLTFTQKDALLRHLRQVFMSSVLEGAGNVIAYLTS